MLEETEIQTAAAVTPIIGETPIPNYSYSTQYSITQIVKSECNEHKVIEALPSTLYVSPIKEADKEYGKPSDVHSHLTWHSHEKPFTSGSDELSNNTSCTHTEENLGSDQCSKRVTRSRSKSQYVNYKEADISDDFPLDLGLLVKNEIDSETDEAYHECVEENKPLIEEIKIEPENLVESSLLAFHSSEMHLSESCAIQHFPNPIEVIKSELKHELCKSVEKPLRCSQCERMFATNYQLQVHLKKQHQSDLPYKFICYAVGCEKAYCREEDLKQHSYTHLENPFVCNQCKKTFGSLNILNKHIQKLGIHNTPKPANWVCSFDGCGKAFSGKANLIRHTRTHTGENPFGCSQCDRMFRTKFRLKDHFLNTHDIHYKPKQFSCPVDGCTWVFKNKKDVTRHSKTHSEMAFGCNQCRKKFRTETSLKYHLEKHANAEKFPCLVKDCGKVFRKNSALKRHSAVHSGEKPFECNQCNKRFFRKDYLEKHLRMHLRLAKTNVDNLPE